MKNTWLLLKIQLSNILGFNRIIHLKDKGERRRKLAGRIAIYACMLLALPAFGVYAFLMAMGMDAMGQIGLFPGLMLAVQCVMTLISSVSLANGTLFAFRDYELTMSLPVRSSEIALSRLMLGYVSNLFFDLMIMIPCCAVYAWFVRPAFSFYPIFLLTMLAGPVVPMVAGSLIGAIVARLLASVRGAKYLQMLGSTVLCLGIMAMSMNMESLMEGGMFGDIGVMLGNLMNRIYPLTGLYVSAVRDLSWAAALAFVLIAAAVMMATALLMGKFMRQINTALTTTRAKGKYRMRALKTSSPLKALYIKELKRYLSSTIYLFNTAFGLIMALVGVGILAVKGRDMLNIALAAFELAGLDDRLVAYALGYVAAFLIVTCCTTSCSVSLEGKNLWLIQSLPVTGFQVLLSKLLVNLTLTVPTSLIIGLGVGWTLSMDPINTLAITAMALSYSLMDAALGLMINLKSHSFDWTTDAVVVKQGAANGIAIFAGMALIIAPAVLTFVFVEYATLIFWLATAVMALIGAGLVLAFRKKGDQWIRNL